jgi:hypothetical protein
MNSPSQRPLTDNAQQNNIHAPAGFEPIIPASERLQIHAFDRAANGFCQFIQIRFQNIVIESTQKARKYLRVSHYTK